MKKNNKGFTIVELVIVIAVIAILAAVLIPTFSGVVDKANSSAALQTARSTLTNALNMSSNASLAGQDSTTKEYRTIFIVDGYAYGYTGNTLEQINYPGYKNEAKLKKYNSETESGNYNAILIAADNIKTTYSDTVVTSNAPTDWASAYTSYYTKDSNNKYIENASSVFDSSKMYYKAIYTLDASIVNILTGANNSIAVTEMTGTITITKSINGIYTISDDSISASLYLNSDFSKKVVVFTTFGE